MSITKMNRWTLAALTTVMLMLGSVPVESRAILGIDLGSLYMKVALVQRGAPLEIVTNLHSKRKTENMILFDANTRFYGADASSLLARKPLKTPVSMSTMLGRDDEHPAVKVLSDRHFPITPKFNESRSGSSVVVAGEIYTPEELVAMLLSHAKDITQAYVGDQGTAGKASSPRDCVLTVPAFATIHERRALLDAAVLADLNVLSLIDENTAAAVHFAMDKLYEEEQILIFYNLGASSLQVSVVKIHSYSMKGGGTSTSKTKENKVSSVEVLSKAWDSTLGGQEFDNRIVEFLADEFNEQWDKKRGDGKKRDVREIPRAMTKLRLQANKVKHVLSANSEIPIFMESVYDDTRLSTHMTRVQLEEACADLLDRAVTPLNEALASAKLTMENVTDIELIGGGMRVPKVQSKLRSALNDMVLGMHINADESMALGAAFHGANVSTAFRVRHVGLTDVNPFPIAISLEDIVEEEKTGFFGGKKKEVESDDEPWSKHATIFKVLGKLGVKKTIAFTHDNDVHCALDYEENSGVPEGTSLPVGRYNVTGVKEFAKEMEDKGLGKPKVSLQFELSFSGITRIIKAEAAVEETYMGEEQIEVEDEDAEEESEDAKESDEESDAESKKESDTAAEKEKDSEGADADKAGANETDTIGANETDANATQPFKKFKKKKMKKVTVEKEKKRIHKRALVVTPYHVGKIQPLSEAIFEESKAKLESLAKKDAERIQLEEARNKVESYVYFTRNKLSDDEEAIGEVSTEEQREAVSKFAEETEDWMYDDGSTADLETLEDRYQDLSAPMEEILFRVSEKSERPAAIKALQAKLVKVEELLKKWETTHPQITEEEKLEVLAKVETAKAWITEKEAEQDKKVSHEEPAFTSTDVPKQAKSLQGLVKRLSKKPKPKVEKNTTDTNSTNTTNSTEEDATESSEKVDEDATSEEDTASDGEDASSEEQTEETDASEESEESSSDAEAKKGDGEL